VLVKPSRQTSLIEAQSSGISMRTSTVQLQSRFVWLEPVRPRMVPYIYELLLQGSGDLAFSGSIPSFDDFAESFTKNVYLHFVVCQETDTSARGELVGYIRGYRYEPQHGHAWVAMCMEPASVLTPKGADALLLFLGCAFSKYPLRKIYLSRICLQPPPGAMDRFFTRESVLKEHVFTKGEYADRYVYSVTKAQHETMSATFASRESTSDAVEVFRDIERQFSLIASQALGLEFPLSLATPFAESSLDSFDLLILFQLLEDAGVSVELRDVDRITCADDLLFHLIQGGSSSFSDLDPKWVMS
jgi:hypothetical protein